VTLGVETPCISVSFIVSRTHMKHSILLASLIAVSALAACGKKEAAPAPAPAAAPAPAPAAAPAAEASAASAPAAAAEASAPASK